MRPPCPALLGALLLLANGCERPSAPPAATSSTTTASAPSLAADSPAWFTDITTAAGLHFLHAAGTNYAMPEQVGSGIALFDFDRDGRLDVYCVQNAGPDVPREAARNQLFRQRTDGTFANVSSGSGLDVAGRGMGAIAGDANNDGLPDLVVTEYGATRLFQNLGGGKFQEITAAAGLDNPRWAAPASFLDFDRDGRLDLVVGNYLDYDATQVCHDVQGRQDFCAPAAFGGTITRLWRNVTPTAGAAPRFEDVTEHAGLTRAPGVALGILAADFTGDGWVDIFCADDGRPNRLFVNQRQGTFVEEAVTRGLAYNAMGRPAANMGIAYADIEGDGRGDLFITHLAEEFHSLFRQDQPGLFTDAIAQAGLQTQAFRGTGFGTVFADFDRDGDLDLAFVNGLVRRATPGQTPVASGTSSWWERYAQRPQVFANDGRGRFTENSAQHPAFTGAAAVGRTLAMGDLDQDGAPDLVVGNIGGPVRVLRNTSPPGHHWLRLSLVEPAFGNRDAIGAEAVVQSASRRHWALLQPATSYLASHEPVLHFGLGTVARVDGIEIRWADGTRESFPAAPADQQLTLRHGTGQALPP